MSSENLKSIEAQRQVLLGQLKSAEASLRAGVEAQGFGNIARAHLERALAHVQEARIAIDEFNRARTVQQLVDDLVRLEQACDEFRRQPPPGVTVKSPRP